MKTKIVLLTLALAGITVPALRADLLNINISGDIRLGRRPPPPPPAVVVIDTHYRASSPWERRYRPNERIQAYYYYPGSDVYYRQADHVWIYRDRGGWRSARNLPPGISVDFNRNVTLNMFTDRPYDFHQQVTASYPSNYFGTRVRVRDDDRHDNEGRGHDKDDHGRDDHGRDHR